MGQQGQKHFYGNNEFATIDLPVAELLNDYSDEQMLPETRKRRYPISVRALDLVSKR